MNAAPHSAPVARALAAGPRRSLVTAEVAGQLFGIQIDCVQDIFPIAEVTPVPLAAAEILGLVAVRGRIVTLIGIRQRLGLQPRATRPGDLAIRIEAGNEPYALAVDGAGEIVEVAAGSLEPLPVHLHAAWSGLSNGVHRLASGLLVAIDLEAMLDVSRPALSPGRNANRGAFS